MSSQEFPTPPELRNDSTTSLEEYESPLLTDWQSWQNTRQLLMELSLMVKPPPKRNAAEWADQNRVLPLGNAEPGPWKSSRTPWIPQIHERIKHHNARQVTVVMGSQMSKTDGVALNAIGQRLDDDPVPCLYVGPTKSNVENAIEPRVEDMFKQSSSLSRRLVRSKKRARRLIKKVGAVTFRLAWAGSATELASQPAGVVAVDEVDRMPPIPGEGDVTTIVTGRMDTFPDPLLMVLSTPTIGSVTTEVDPETGIELWKKAEPEDLHSPIWTFWQEGTMHVWVVPCLGCGLYFMPRFGLLCWPPNLEVDAASRRAGLRCPRQGCANIHFESDHSEMNRRGVFIRRGERPEDVLQKKYLDADVIHLSFWVSGIMSPWVSFQKSAYRWITAVNSGKSERIQSTMNVRFGELWKLNGEAPPWESVQKKSDGLGKMVVPDWAQRIYLTVDVQKLRLVLNARAWGFGFQSRLLFHDDIWVEDGKDTGDPDVWDKLQKIIEDGFNDKPYDAVAIDSGYETQRVYSFVSSMKGQNVIATKGFQNPKKLFQAFDAEVDQNGKKVRYGIKFWGIDSDYFKGWIHDHINWPNDKPGGWYVYQGIEEGYCKELVAEQKMVLESGRIKWIKVSEDNHQLDCEVLQVFLAHQGDVRYLKDVKTGNPRLSYAEMAKRLNGG